MRFVSATALTLAGALCVAPLFAQQDAARKVPGGGIIGSGWQGKIDANEAAKGSVLNDSKFEAKASAITINSGPAGIYWNPANSQSGDFTVSATFTEPQYQSAMGHPHPYGLFIGGNKLDTDSPTLLYCAAYGDGRYIVRAFPTSFAPPGPSGRRPAAHEAVKKAAAKGEPVTQQISMSLKGSRVTCSINGAEVANLSKDELVGAGKLDSIQGNVGIRVSHNVDVNVTDFKVTKQ
jgi:hypothetical protein